MQGEQRPSWGVGGCREGGEQVQSFQAPCGNPGAKSMPAFLLARLSPAPQRLRPHPAPYPAPRPRAHPTRRGPLTWGAGPLGPSPRTGTTSLLRSDPVCQGDGTSRAAFPEPSTRAPALRRRPSFWGWGRPPEGHGKVLQGAAARAPCWLARSLPLPSELALLAAARERKVAGLAGQVRLGGNRTREGRACGC